MMTILFIFCTMLAAAAIIAYRFITSEEYTTDKVLAERRKNAPKAGK